MTSRTQTAMLILANLLIPTAILTFAVGFFPYKPFIPGLATFRPLDQYEALPKAPFDKVVFMVVDALRSDFVYSPNSGFRFTQSLIASGSALPFTAHATSPTITMPRVKAITTGSIPSFLDVILNFAESDTTSSLANQDTWLAQLAAKPEGKLVMYGDDTWLKLFPDTFSRADGTSSFFVSDFTEVDNNVTRHVPEELANSDWTGMIMHYLGLDHIGHKTGPLGPHMIPKQTEMDGIVKQIYEAIESQSYLGSTLLVLCGDHGMNEGGNHGGSAPGETSPALVFISPKFKQISGGMVSPTQPKGEFDYYTKVEQSDIAPTLAGLLGFPVPLNNLGVFIPDLLAFWTNPLDKIQILHRNARQILDIVQATFPTVDFSSKYDETSCRKASNTGDELACKWRKAATLLVSSLEAHSQENSDSVAAAFLEFCRSAQSELSSTASNYNVNLLVGGLAMSSIALALSLFTLTGSLSSVTYPGVFFSLATILYGVMMFASSYVEEEQHFWYWSSSAWLFLLFVHSIGNTSSKPTRIFTNPYLISLLLLRIARRYNQTGQKHAGAPDIVHSTLFTTPWSLWILIGVTYATLVVSLKSDFIFNQRQQSRSLPDYTPSELLAITGAASIGSIAFAFKLAFTAKDAPELLQGLVPGLEAWLEDVPLVPLARMVFYMLAAGFLWLFTTLEPREATGKRRLSAGIFDILTILIVTQTRSQNIPLFLLFRIMYWQMSTMPTSPIVTTITTLLMSHVSFYALGNSNAISSIDLSNAYNGVSGYNIVMVGILVFVSNWAGPIWWCAAGVRLLQISASAAGDKQASSSNSRVSKVRFQEQHEASLSTTTNEPSKPRPWIESEHRALSEAAKHPPSFQQPPPSNSRESSASSNEPLLHHIKLLTVFTTASLLAVMAACTILRTHLFIWTVFSPKYLYAMAWGTLWHLVTSVGLGWCLWRA